MAKFRYRGVKRSEIVRYRVRKKDQPKLVLFDTLTCGHTIVSPDQNRPRRAQRRKCFHCGDKEQNG